MLLSRDPLSVIFANLAAPRDVAAVRGVCRAWRAAAASRWAHVEELCVLHRRVHRKRDTVVSVFSKDRVLLRDAMRFVLKHRDGLARALLSAFFGTPIVHCQEPSMTATDVYDLYRDDWSLVDTLVVCNTPSKHGMLGFYRSMAASHYEVSIVDFLAYYTRPLFRETPAAVAAAERAKKIKLG